LKTLTLNGRTLGELTILTEKTHYGINECTMENARAANEEPYFGQTGAGNEVATTRTDILTIPRQTTGGDWQSNTSISHTGADMQQREKWRWRICACRCSKYKFADNDNYTL